MRNRNNKFLEAYYKNIGLQTEQALEASPVASYIIKFMDSRIEWNGTATELLDELEEVAVTTTTVTNPCPNVGELYKCYYCNTFPLPMISLNTKDMW